MKNSNTKKYDKFITLGSITIMVKNNTAINALTTTLVSVSIFFSSPIIFNCIFN